MMQRTKSDFTTLTLTLISLAMVINIVVGQIVQNVLKLPIYLDSIGTVLVAVLAGPLAGALTGALSNILWGIIFSSPNSIPFSIVAFAIGLVAGLWAQGGGFKRELPLAQGLGLVLLIGAVLVGLLWVNAGPTGGLIALGVVGLVVVLTALRIFPALVAVGGVLTGMIAAVVSAPIAAFVFGGVMGSGTDLLVALFQASGANILQATMGQGLVSDPFDKFVSFVIVWFILRSMSRRYLARFPRAENVAENVAEGAR